MNEQQLPSPEVRQHAMAALERWLRGLEGDSEFANAVAAVVVDEESELDRWFVRLNGVAKDVYSVWFELGERTLAFETFVLPAPEENHAAFFEQLLVRNDRLRDIAFTIGAEQAIFLKGRLDLAHVADESLDRVLGSIYAAVEQSFQPALRLGFASRFPKR